MHSMHNKTLLKWIVTFNTGMFPSIHRGEIKEIRFLRKLKNICEEYYGPPP